MGLDITYVSNAHRLRAVRKDDEYTYSFNDELTGEVITTDYVEAYINHDFNRHDNLKEGIYSYDEMGYFRAGSYAYYCTWRDELARLLGYAPNKCSRYFPHSDGAGMVDSGPFHELIVFSDCEGIIGPITSAKLAKDFNTYSGKLSPTVFYHFHITYEKFKKAFEVASNNGFVKFH